MSRRGQTEPPLDGSLQHNYQDDDGDDGADDDGDILKDSVKSNDDTTYQARCSLLLARSESSPPLHIFPPNQKKTL